MEKLGKEYEGPLWGRSFLLAVLLCFSVLVISMGIARIKSQSKNAKDPVHRESIEKPAVIARGLIETALISMETKKEFEEIGLNEEPPLPGKSHVSFKKSFNDFILWGEFNGKGPDASTYCPVPDTIDIYNFCFNPAGDSSGFSADKLPLSANYGRIIYHIKDNRGVQKTHCIIYSVNSLFGISAPAGTVKLNNAISTVNRKDPISIFKDSGLRYHIISEKTPQFFGSPRGYAPPDSEDVEFAEEGVEKLFKDLVLLEKSMEKNSADPGFRSFAGALSKALNLFDGYEMIDTFDYTWDGKTLEWGGSLIIPDNRSVKIPFNIRIKGNLILGKNSLLSSAKDITVEGSTVLAPLSSLFAKGNLSLENTLKISYGNEEIPAVVSCAGAKGDVIIKKGIRRLPGFTNPSGRGIKYVAIPSPFPLKIPYYRGGVQYLRNNPRADAFLRRQKASARFLDASIEKISVLNSQRDIPAAAVEEVRNVPGLLIASSGGNVLIEDDNPDGMSAGLVLAQKNITLVYPPGGRGVFTGILLSNKGDVTAPNVTYRYYPYYSYARIYLGKEGHILIKSLIKPHITYRGEIE